MNKPKITFGFVNCNRLFYLKSCIKSLVRCVSDYPNKEFIVVDNASVEKGTKEYLDELEKSGFIVFRKEKRDPSNEFAKALNIIASNSTGDFIMPLQGDCQFILENGWIEHFVDLCNSNKHVGSIALDAQRHCTISGMRYSKNIGSKNFPMFFREADPIPGAADCFLSRKVLEKIFPWNEYNLNHEGGSDSETHMLNKVNKIMTEEGIKWMSVTPLVPVAACIYTDFRGTNSRIRENRRYGDYWAPKEDDYQYYKIKKIDDLKINLKRDIPYSIEEVVESVGWNKNDMLDQFGNWKKNPIDPKTATSNDYKEL